MGKYMFMCIIRFIEIFLYFCCVCMYMEVFGNFFVFCFYVYFFVYEVLWFKEIYMYYDCLYVLSI